MSLLWIYLGVAFLYGVILSLGAVYTPDLIFKLGKEGVIVPFLREYYKSERLVNGKWKRDFTYLTIGSAAGLNVVFWPILLPWAIILGTIFYVTSVYANTIDAMRESIQAESSDNDGDGNSPNES